MLLRLRRGLKLYVVLGLLLAALVVVGQMYSNASEDLGQPISAKIQSFSVPARDAKYRPGEITVFVVTDDGAMGQARVHQSRLSGCKVGDEVRAFKNGIRITPQPQPCDHTSEK